MTDLQKRMFAEMRDKTVYERALQYGFEYTDRANGRNVFPTTEALAGLSHFDEPLPDGPAGAEGAVDIIDNLHKHGSPAAVTHVGGRYFGFVTGSVVPAGMAAKLLGTFWDQVTAMYVLSPVSAKLEQVVEGWLRDIFGLPEGARCGRMDPHRRGIRTLGRGQPAAFTPHPRH